MDTHGSSFQISPVGRIVRPEGGPIAVQVDAAYRAALKGLDTFSHVVVVWWAQRFDEAQYREVLVVPLPYAGDREAGVFACRSPLRPNLIMTTVCRIVAVDETLGIIQIENIDAFDGTPVLDLKPYFPVTDRVQDARISPDLVGWPEWMPDEGIGLMDGEA